jgi:DNA-directed RNA polymerase delta subunit
MENKSVLSTILTNQKLNDLAEFNVVELISFLLGQLNQRERDVISRRYGLLEGEREILESIGQIHGLTRERIRQIEVSSLKKLRNMKELEQIRKLRKIIIQLMEEHGGLMELEYLMENLIHFSMKDAANAKKRRIYENFYTLLMARILNDDFTEVTNSRHLLPYLRLNYQTTDHFEDLAQALEKSFKEKKDVLRTHELIEWAKEHDFFDQHKEKFEIDASIDLSGIFRKGLYKEQIDVINRNKVLYSAFRAAKSINQNVFGHWGIHDWPEIKPRNLNDKIYLILKHNSEPMHFSDIAQKIDHIGFDKKKTNVASAHNELILDKKYVLVGRGLYGLKEWGLKKGTVADVITEVLKESSEPLSKDEIINRVLEKRRVKKTTIQLALSSRGRFDRVADKYALREVNYQE